MMMCIKKNFRIFILNLRARRGFTLIELLVTVSIMIVLSSVIVAGYQYGQNKYALNNAVNRLASDIRKTQNMAMSGVEIEGKYCSIGVFLAAASQNYIIFGNTDCKDHMYNAGTDEIIETIDLGVQITVNDLLVITNNTTATDNLSIAFEPPRPATYINRSKGPRENIEAVIVLANDDYNRQIMVTGTGAIGVKFEPVDVPVAKYLCSGSSCVRDDKRGTFTSSDCDNTCIVPKYRCLGSSCIRDDVSGIFTSSDCDKTCVVAKYRCFFSFCIRDDKRGTFTDPTCNNSCSW